MAFQSMPRLPEWGPLPVFTAQVMAGDTLDFTVRGQTEAAQFQIIFNEAMLAGAASTELSRTLDVIDMNVRAIDTVLTGTLPWSYEGTVRVRTRVAYAMKSDVQSIIANAFFKAAGNMPQVSTDGAGLPRIELPDLNFKWTTAVVVGSIAILVLAWKF